MTTVFRDIGAYRIIREIGHGGMATVFLAEDSLANLQRLEEYVGGLLVIALTEARPALFL